MIVAPPRSRMPATQTSPLAAPPSPTPAVRVPTPQPVQEVHERPLRPALSVVDPLPQSLPPWLIRLIAIRKLSTPVVTLIILGVLPLYGWSVYTQQSWGKTYQKLEDMRQEEHQLLLLNETHKYKVTQDAEKNPKGLTKKGPHNTLFVPPATYPAAAPETQRTTVKPEWVLPIGY